jgi:hypothetical protein
MIPAPISITGRLDLQDQLDIHRCHLRVMVRTSIRWCAMIFSASLIVLVMTFGCVIEFKPVVFLALVIFAYYPFGWWIIDRLRVRMRYAAQREKFIDHTVTFTNDSVSCSSAVYDMRLNWDQIFTVVNASRGLLILLPENAIWFWLPQRLFDGNELKYYILDLAKEHLIPIRNVG